MATMMKPETRERILLQSISLIDNYNESINTYLRLYKKSESAKELIHAGLYLSMVGSDFAVLIKQYMRANQRWEEIVIAQQLYIKLNESVKKTIGFEEKNRSKSYWIKIVGSYVKQKPELEALYNDITKKLVSYVNNNELQELVKSVRDIAVHGDDKLDTINHFRTLNELNMNMAFQFFIEWGYILEETNKFIMQELNTYD